MIPAIGIIVSLYTLTRYAEMFDNRTWKGKIWLALVAFITIILMIDLVVRQS